MILAKLYHAAKKLPLRFVGAITIVFIFIYQVCVIMYMPPLHAYMSTGRTVIYSYNITPHNESIFSIGLSSLCWCGFVFHDKSCQECEDRRCQKHRPLLV